MSKRKFEKFYNQHMDKVYRYVFFRVSRDRELAQDLVSEIFIKALNNFSKYDEKSEISVESAFRPLAMPPKTPE